MSISSRGIGKKQRFWDLDGGDGRDTCDALSPVTRKALWIVPLEQADIVDFSSAMSQRRMDGWWLTNGRPDARCDRGGERLH